MRIKELRHPSLREDKPEPLLWALTVAVMILAICVISGGLYLNARRTAAEQREAETRQAICVVLNAIPPHSHMTPPRERAAFKVAYRKAGCHPLPRVKPTPTPLAPHPHVTAPAVVVSPHPAVVVRPTARATAVATAHPTPRPSKQPTRKPTHTPTPKPTASPSCLLGIQTPILCTK